jgi:hypothetical protein
MEDNQHNFQSGSDCHCVDPLKPLWLIVDEIDAGTATDFTKQLRSALQLGSQCLLGNNFERALDSFDAASGLLGERIHHSDAEWASLERIKAFALIGQGLALASLDRETAAIVALTAGLEGHLANGGVDPDDAVVALRWLTMLEMANPDFPSIRWRVDISECLRDLHPRYRGDAAQMLLALGNHCNLHGHGADAKLLYLEAIQIAKHEPFGETEFNQRSEVALKDAVAALLEISHPANELFDQLRRPPRSGVDCR